MGDIVAAFSEEHASRLTGITKPQLRYWDRIGFYSPAYAESDRSLAFSRIYSFKDIAALRVLNSLRNQFGVPLQHLRKVSANLSHLAEDRWTGVRLWVVNKKVIWQEPGTDRPQEIVSGQYLVSLSLDEALSDTRDHLEKLNQRGDDLYGCIERSRFINHNAPVIAGTRIPVDAIKRFSKAGFSVSQIIDEYPGLTERDVEAALAYDSRSAA